VTVRFLADEDLDSDIIEGLRSHEPAIDILNTKETGLRGTKDPDLLEFAAQQERILISHDRRTMIRHFRDRLLSNSPQNGVRRAVLLG
jgi:predicted nuclease of predicted toxin-antitoxin system